jgi:hypothetical protein
VTVEIHEGWDRVPAGLQEQWSALVETGGYNPSLHPRWQGALLSAWGLGDSTRIAVIHERGDAVAFIPFLVRRRTVTGLPLRVLELASNVFSYHAEIVCKADPAGALTQLLDHERLPSWDAFRADNLVADGPTAQAIRSLKGFARVSSRAGERSPYALIDRDWTAYLATRAKKVRANILRAQRLMKEAGETGMEWYGAAADTRRLLDEMLQIETRSWKADAGAAIVAGTPQCTYYERLLPWLADKNALMANVLYIKDRPCAYTLCATWNGWIGQLKTSFVAELRDAGSRVIHTSLERAFQGGGREYDFLGDTAPHKTRWADCIRPHEDLWGFARHLRGRLLAGVKAVADYRHQRLQMQAAAKAAAAADES